MKNKSFVVWALLIVVLVFAAAVFLGKKTQPGPAAPSSFVMAPAYRADNQSYGNPNSKVVVVEFFDPQCETCRKVHPVVKKLIKDLGGQVHFVHRYMPFHEHSMFASTALEEARASGKYDQALDILFETQDQWGDHMKPQSDLIITLLSKLGIPKAGLNEQVLLKKHGAQVLQDRDDGRALGVRQTPQFIINGRLIEGISDEEVRAAIALALKEN